MLTLVKGSEQSFYLYISNEGLNEDNVLNWICELITADRDTAELLSVVFVSVFTDLVLVKSN